ncbi:MAG: radical SAM protein [Desulfobacterales bacterium]|jgi:radical SAM protein with 4Fe4S-binding SPASM domain|nr:radical SAM protein [Desulfobacterales bacterium]
MPQIPLKDFPLWQARPDGHAPMIAMNLEITARCNHDCRHCYINLPEEDRAAKASELSCKEIETIADEAVSLGVLWVLITGGEPLLREDFAEIYLALKKKGLLVSVFTNATLITEEHVRLFKAYPPRAVEISVYGVTRETYERVTRRKGAFAAFSRGLGLMAKNALPVTLKAMAMQSNLKEMANIAAFCRIKSSNPFRFDPLLHLRYDRNPLRNKEIRAERLTPAQITDLEQGDAARKIALKKGCEQLMLPWVSARTDSALFICGAGIGECTVSADGRFRLCAALCHPDCQYDLKSGSLTEALTHVVPRIRAMQSQQTAYLETCRKCSLINLCHWCPAHAFLETGELDLPVDYFCDVAKARWAVIDVSNGGKRG